MIACITWFLAIECMNMESTEQDSPVEIIVSFGKQGVVPHIMKWGKATYKIAKVNLIHTIKDGAIRIYFFSVSDDTNAWKLGFNTETLTWWVEDQYSLAEHKFNCLCEDPSADGDEAIPMEEKSFYIYILTNKNNTTLYTGVTNALKRRVWEHKEKSVSGFTKKYNLNKLVYYELCGDAYRAISREKQIKGGSRETKIRLIQDLNPSWEDLYNKI